MNTHSRHLTCLTCSRSDANRLFYCASCLTKRLAEHHHRLIQSTRLVEFAQAKALALLEPRSSSVSPSSSSSSSSTTNAGYGVEEERLLKADKWEYAIRVKELRIAKEELGKHLDRDRKVLQDRRKDLLKRRENLIKARRLLSTNTSHNTTSSSSSSTAQIKTLRSSHQSLRFRIAQVRQILIRELLSIYSFEPLSIDPFSSTTIPTTYQISTLPLPTNLIEIVFLPQPELCAILSHLSQMIRLFAIYFDQSLPFLILPNLFGMGRPGVKASPLITVASRKIGALGGGLGVSWPLFISRTKSTSTSTPTSSKISTRKDQNDSSPSSSSSSSTTTAVVPATTPNELKKIERMKIVLFATLALAYNLAHLSFIRSRQSLSNEKIMIGIEGMNDLGELIRSATKDYPPSSIPLLPSSSAASSSNVNSESTIRAQAIDERQEQENERRIEIEIEVGIGFSFDHLVESYLEKFETKLLNLNSDRGIGRSDSRWKREKWNKVRNEHLGDEEQVDEEDEEMDGEEVFVELEDRGGKEEEDEWHLI